jgi:hypothetical protein
MNFFKQWGNFMMEGAKAHARWEIQMSANILGEPQTGADTTDAAGADHPGRHRVR